jgi:hypothetical protein
MPWRSLMTGVENWAPSTVEPALPSDCSFFMLTPAVRRGNARRPSGVLYERWGISETFLNDWGCLERSGRLLPRRRYLKSRTMTELT